MMLNQNSSTPTQLEWADSKVWNQAIRNIHYQNNFAALRFIHTSIWTAADLHIDTLFFTHCEHRHIPHMCNDQDANITTAQKYLAEQQEKVKKRKCENATI